ncbi:unnamed protein product [Blepharisma stoltei]|uniref:Uncharacterized protein n=1 Tax=Blepharisma stoltei TaxID=1481888 RepID=A0AAU9J2R4_9CILI|nr:unnamed protein product [Blepharisma stoltei]
MISSKFQKPKAYSSRYKTACSKLNTPANNQIMSTLNKYEFSLNYETIQDRDLKPLGIALPHLTQIKKIIISNNNKNKPEIPFSKPTKRGSSTARSSKQANNYDSSPEHSTFANSKEKEEFESKRKNKGIAIFKAISENLEHNKHLTVLVLEQLNIEMEGWGLLGRGFTAKLPLNYLAIVECKLKDKEFACFAPSLGSLRYLEALNLSRNDLEDCGFDIARVISKNNERIDEGIWVAGLRGEQPEMVGYGKGLDELDLSYNKIKDKTIYDLSSALYTDTILKSLDISNNSISIQGLQEIISVLYSNSTLLYVNILGNGDKIPINYAKAILKKLKTNLKRYRLRRNYSGDWEQKIANIQSSLGPILLTSEPASPKASEKRPKVVFTNSESQVSKGMTSETPIDYEDCQEEFQSEPDFSDSESSYIPPRKGLLGYDHTPLHEAARKKSPESCNKCKEFERALFKSESTCMALTEKIKKLENRIAVLERRSPDINRQSPFGYQSSVPENDIETLNRIDDMMKELTKLVDAFEKRNPEKSKSLFRYKLY